MQDSRRSSGWLTSTGLGLSAGLLVLGLDLALAASMLGTWVPVRPRDIVAHAAIGVVAMALVTLAGRGRVSAIARLSMALIVVYAASIAERAATALSPRTGVALTTLGAVAAIAALAGLTWFMARLARSRATGATIASLVAAILLAANRHLVGRPTDLDAIALDAGVTLGGLVAAAICSRTRIRLPALGAAVAFVLLAAVWPRDVAPPPSGSTADGVDVVLLSIDTLRYDVFAEVVESTAEGQRLGAHFDDAVWFTAASATAPWTAPTVGSILSGLYPEEHGFGRTTGGMIGRPLQSLDDGVRTFPDRLHEAGWATTAIVTNPLLHPVSGIAQGFDHYRFLRTPTDVLPSLTVLTRLGLMERAVYVDAASVERTLRRDVGPWAALDRPLFLWLHLMDPHAPLATRRDYLDSPGPWEEEALYRAEVRFTADRLASMIDQLKRWDRWDDALVILVADHGEMFPSDGHSIPMGADRAPRDSGHGHALYEELVRVPLVIKPAGGIRNASRSGALVSQVDVAPIVLAAAGLIADPDYDLEAWVRPRADRERGRNSALLGTVQVPTRQHGIRTPRFKLIRFSNRDLPSQLFDLRRDPEETADLASEQPEIVDRLSRRLDRERSRLVPVEEAADMELDAETEERLRALGYVD